MASVNISTKITLNEFEKSIAVMGRKRTIVGRGEPGIGKSTTLYRLGERFPTHKLVYMDCQLLLDQGDFFYPTIEVTDVGSKVARRVPLEDFDFSDGVPVIFNCDELGKANKPVLNVLLTLLYDRRIHNKYLPEGSIVFGSTNLTSDGVGDFVAAHARSRVILTTVKKPHVGMGSDGSVDPDGWAHWAFNNGIAPELLAWLKSNQHAFDSYTDHNGKEKWSNPYAYHPTQGAESYVCPRSMHAVSDICKERHLLGSELTLSLMAGAAGESFARDFSAFLVVKDRLTSVEAIVSTPDHAAIPDATDSVALCVMVFNLVTATKTETIKPFVTYMQRLPKEYQALFARSVMANDEKQKTAVQCTEFRTWSMANHWMF
jgi:hypothetical protein